MIKRFEDFTPLQRSKLRPVEREDVKCRRLWLDDARSCIDYQLRGDFPLHTPGSQGMTFLTLIEIL